MTDLIRSRHPLIGDAITLSRGWCKGHIIDGSPALGHALKVAGTVNKHLPSASPELLAAVIMHDAPYFAPADVDLDYVLADSFGSGVLQIVRAIEAEHKALETDGNPDVEIADTDVLIASAADKAVSIAAIIARARRSQNPAGFWSDRRPFLDRINYFQDFVEAVEQHVPRSLARELAAVVTGADEATVPYRR